MAALGKNMQTLRKLTVCSCYCKPNSLKHIRTTAAVFAKGDPLPYFVRDDVQTILQRITGYNPEKTFYTRKLRKPQNPNIQILTDEELEKNINKAKKIKEQRLQMPPFMNCRESVDVVMSDDADIAPALTSKYVFIDISDACKRIQVDTQRPIVCRHEDGKLKVADWSTIDRVTQIYGATRGRSVYMPKMFEEEHLERMIREKKYIYVLERACIQFEPDSSDFIRVTHKIYERITQNDDFDILRCTRFFGPMSFYLAWYNKIEPLVVDMINNDLLVDAVDLINLNRIVHEQSVKEGDIFEIIRDYCLDGSKKLYVESLKVALDKLDKRLEMKAKMQEQQEMNAELSTLC